MPGRHDALFKVAFSQPANAAALACCNLSPAMQALFDWSTLRLRPGSFVNEALAGRHTDLLFEVQSVLGKMLLYILFEHQSLNYVRMPLRMGRYMDRIWDDFVQARLASASSGEIELWAERVLFANTLEQVLDEPTRREPGSRPGEPAARC